MTTDKRYMVWRPMGPLAGKRFYNGVREVSADIRSGGQDPVFVYLRNYLAAEWNGGKLTIKSFCPRTIQAALEAIRREHNHSTGRQFCHRLLASEDVTRVKLDDLGFLPEPTAHSPVYQSRKNGETAEVYETRDDVGILFRRPSPSRTGSIVERWRYNGSKTN